MNLFIVVNIFLIVTQISNNLFYSWMA